MFVIDDAGVQLGSMERDAALRLADERGMDLVEVAPNVRPPVCRLMDYSKFKYRQSKKKQKSHILAMKEIRVRPKTDDHDLEVKIRKAREFLEKGHKVMVSMRFKGREMAHIDFGQLNMKKIVEGLMEVAKVETPAKMMGPRMNLMLAPLKVPQQPKESGE